MFNTYLMYIINVIIVLSLIYIALLYFCYSLKNLMKEVCSGTLFHRVSYSSFLPQDASVTLSLAVYMLGTVWNIYYTKGGMSLTNNGPLLLTFNITMSDIV